MEACKRAGLPCGEAIARRTTGACDMAELLRDLLTVLDPSLRTSVAVLDIMQGVSEVGWVVSAQGRRHG